MYFLKRHILNIIICMLGFGVLATVVNFFIPPASTTYEEHYTLETALEPNSIAETNIHLNEAVNITSNSVQVAEVEAQANSDILTVNITTEAGLNYDSIDAQVQDILGQEGIVVQESLGSTSYETANVAIQLLIVLLGLIIGALVGIIYAVKDNNISSDEDIQYHLNERTLGTF